MTIALMLWQSARLTHYCLAMSEHVENDPPEIWYFELPDHVSPHQMTRWSGGLDPAESLAINRFRDPARRLQAIASRALLRRALSLRFGGPPHRWRFSSDQNGRPFIASPPTGSDFNLAHTARMVAVGLCASGRVGVDVEHLDRSDEIREVSERILSDDEKAKLGGLDDAGSRVALVTLWTLKEAWAKATGAGLSADFRQASFELSTRADGFDARLTKAVDWRFLTHILPSGCILSVAAKGENLQRRGVKDANRLMLDAASD